MQEVLNSILGQRRRVILGWRMRMREESVYSKQREVYSFFEN